MTAHYAAYPILCVFNKAFYSHRSLVNAHCHERQLNYFVKTESGFEAPV